MFSSTTTNLPTFNVNRQEDTKAYLWYRKHNSPKNIVAPMVNQSELAYRLLCLRYGADLTYTPMFNSKLFVAHKIYRKEQFETCLGDKPLVVQLCGNEPESIVEAAQACMKKERDDWEKNCLNGKKRLGFVGQGRIVRLSSKHDSIHSAGESTPNVAHPEDINADNDSDHDNDPDLAHDHPYFSNFTSNFYSFDINYGCPQICAKRGYYGAFLMDDLKLVRDIVSTMHNTDKVPIPVTAKIRIFPDVQQTLAYAEMIRDAGAQWLCVHGRTRDQKGRDTGLADWEVIRLIRERITDIPIIANGNIRCTQDIDECIRVTGCDGVMTANGILDNPAIFETKHWVDPNTRVFQRDPHNSNLFVPRSELLLAKEYLNIVDCLQPTIRHTTIRAHLFKLCKPELNMNIDLRSLLSDCTMSLQNFHYIIDEIVHRSRYGLHRGSMDHFFEDPRWNLSREEFENIPSDKYEFRAMHKQTADEVDENDERTLQYSKKPTREAKIAHLRDIIEEDSSTPATHTENFYSSMESTVRRFMELHIYREKRKLEKTEVQENSRTDVLEESNLMSLFA